MFANKARRLAICAITDAQCAKDPGPINERGLDDIRKHIEFPATTKEAEMQKKKKTEAE
jgi:hypothetical protein